MSSQQPSSIIESEHQSESDIEGREDIELTASEKLAVDADLEKENHSHPCSLLDDCALLLSHE